MAATLLLKRFGPALYGADGLAEEELREFPVNVELKAKLTKASGRSLQQHRLYQAVLSLVAKNMDRPMSKDVLHEWVKLRCGVVDLIPLRSGEIEEVPGSIAFDKMDQEDFQKFFDNAMDLICECLTKVGRDDLLAEAREMLGVSTPSDGRG